MQNSLPSAKAKRKRKKNSQNPTTIQFWRQIGHLQNNITSGRGRGNMKVIHPGNPREGIGTFKGAPKINPGNSGQNIRPGSQAQPIQQGKPNVITRNDPDQNIFAEDHVESNFPNSLETKNQPTSSGKPIQLHKAVQKIPPGNPTECNQPSNHGQNIPPASEAKTCSKPNPKGDSGQQNVPVTEAQNQAGSAGEPIPPKDSDKSIQPGKPVPTNQPTDTPGQGPKFKPLKEVEQPKDTASNDNSKVLEIPLPQPTGGAKTILQTTDNKIKTLVGNNASRSHSIAQQKKILKFQMRMQTMQQEKLRQAKVIQLSNMANEQGAANALANAYVGMPNPAVMLQPTGVQNPTSLPNPTGIQTHAGMGVPSFHENQNIQAPNLISVKQTPMAQRVKPVFHKDHHASFAHPVHHPMDAMNMRMFDRYGYDYPKGIPRSFLVQQQKTQQQALSQQTSLPDNMPIWPTFQQNAPMPVQPPNDPNAESPLLVQTDGQGEAPQPYSPSELYSDLDQTLGPDILDTASGQTEKGTRTKQTYQPIHTWSKPLQEAYSEARLKYIIWAQHNKPRKGPIYEDMCTSRKIFKNRKNYFDNNQGGENAAEDQSQVLETASGQSNRGTRVIPNNQPEHTWNKQLQEAYSEARLKYIIWAQHKKPRNGPIYEDMCKSRKILKNRKSIFDMHQGKENAANDKRQLDESETLELSQSCQKRLSAFQRLGPQTQPKKPKLTISLTVNDDQEVREVVDETEEQEEITPVHLRDYLILSTDETVMKYLKSWPWKRNVVLKRSVTARNSKTVMMLEREQMEEIYERDTLYFQITVKGYPPSWKKEQVLDTLLENIRGYSFIPCFIEFNQQECKFLALRCRSALLSLHKCGFVISKDDVDLVLAIGQTELTLNTLDFIPRLVLRKRLHMCADGENKLDLSSFTLKEDISHFIYFPLSRLNNQTELVQIQSDVAWINLTELNLSNNKISCLDGFDLEQITPKLQRLDLSYNFIEKITSLLKCRVLPLKSIHLEGNPLCTDYRDPDQYVKVVKMMFSSVTVIDDIPVQIRGEMPKFHRNYCPLDAKELVDKFLEVYFPLLDGDIEHRATLRDMYDNDAHMTLTYNYKMVFSPIFRSFKTLFQNARQLEQDNMDMIKGCEAITTTIASWPHTEHDPYTFTVDVLYHNETTTVLRVDGILKLTRESLADDEYLLAFSRTIVLHTRDYVEYKILTEMLHWSVPTGAYGKSAFSIITIKSKENPKIDSTTDEKLQGELLKIFMKMTTMDKKTSERCLEIKKWNLKEALEHFSKLLKLDNLESLSKEVSNSP